MVVTGARTLYYVEHLIHKDNLKNVLTHGILSHNKAYKRGLISQDISMQEVQQRRNRTNIDVQGTIVNIHDLVSFYFNSKNPMLFKRRNIQSELFVLLIDANIIDTSPNDPVYAIFSDGNAGSNATKFFYGSGMLTNIDFDLIFADSWNSNDETVKKENRRKRCAEVLVSPSVAPALINKIICPNESMHQYATIMIKSNQLRHTCSHIQVEINRNYFF